MHGLDTPHLSISCDHSSAYIVGGLGEAILPAYNQNDYFLVGLGGRNNFATLRRAATHVENLNVTNIK